MDNSQQKIILAHLIIGNSITSDEAGDLYGIKRLAARISELKSKGFPISKTREYGVNRYGKECHWDRYFIAKEERLELQNRYPWAAAEFERVHKLAAIRV